MFRALKPMGGLFLQSTEIAFWKSKHRHSRCRPCSTARLLHRCRWFRVSPIIAMSVDELYSIRMFKTYLRFGGAFVSAILSVAAVWAGCKTDCKTAYESEVEECHSQYDEPDDADELKQCIEEAKD